MVPNLDTTQAGDGSIQSTGSAQASIRTVTSAYTGAGPTPTRQNAAIFHILDRSGSMGLDKLDSNGQPTKGCSDPAPGLDNRLACLNAGKLWDWHPSVFVKVAAIDFLKFLDSRHDKIGLVTFSGSVSLDQELTDNYSQVEDKIKAYELYDNTNIGGALRMATENLPPVSSGQTRVSILLTDGAPTVSHGPFNPREYALAEANFAKSDEHKIIVITIGLGAAALLPDNDNLLEDMASEVDGKKLHFRAARTQDLKDIYKEIDRFLKEYNIDQGSWNEL
jgi:uncharacterized protein YegL